jgi:hypothetical protein
VAPAVQKRSDEAKVAVGEINKPLEVGPWTVLVKDSRVSAELNGRKADGFWFVTIDYEVTNNSSHPRELPRTFLIDRQKRSYMPISITDSVAINPGITRKISEVYEAPGSISINFGIADVRDSNAVGLIYLNP